MYFILFVEFELRATGPPYVCVGKNAYLKCVVSFIFDDNTSAVIDALWNRNGMIIDATTPHHFLMHSSTKPSRIVGVVVKDVKLYDNKAIYTCTARSAPDNFISSTVLNVHGKT